MARDRRWEDPYYDPQAPPEDPYIPDEPGPWIGDPQGTGDITYQYYPPPGALRPPPLPEDPTQTTPPPVVTDGGNNTNGGGLNGYGGGGNAYAGGGGNGGSGGGFPMFTAPRYQRATPFSYDAFKAPDPFVAPDPNQLAGDPSYQFRLKEGQRALQNSAAARGTLRTGGTLKDLLGYGQSFASQEYNNIYNRAADAYDRNYRNAADTYDRNRNNAFTSWSANTDENRAAYDRDFQASWNEFLPKQRAAELQFGRDWDLFTYMNDDAFRRYALQANIANNVYNGGNS